MTEEKDKAGSWFRLTCLATLIGGFGPVAQAQPLDAERAEAISTLTTPDKEIRLGLGLLSDDNRRLGQYTGLLDQGAYALADVNYLTLEKASGKWIRLTGRDLGLDTRELEFDHYRQGVWRYTLGFGQTVRHEPLQVSTGLTGVGAAVQTINGGTIRPVDFQMKRDLMSFAAEHAFMGNNKVRLRYTHEDKEGARIFGRGNFGTPAAIEFLTEPISRDTQTLELSLSHTGKDLQLSGGYYGTLFVNHAERLDVIGDNTTNALNAPLPAGTPPWSPMSMPLSNDSHQVFMTAGYSLSALTRLAFKGSHTVARQNENFMAVTQPTSPAPVADAPASLDGKVVTTLGYLDLTSTEIDHLDLQANFRFEDRDDQTPEAKFLNVLGVSGLYKPRSWRSMKSKFEAGYQLPLALKAVASFEIDEQERNLPEPFRRVAFRPKTDESTSRLELKRLIAESATGSVAFSQSRRRGSDYVTDTLDSSTLPGLQPSSDVNPLLWADRDRDTWRATLDWVPFSDLSVNLAVDKSNDVYSGRELGPRDGQRTFYSLDASYSITRRWQATLFASYDDTRARQITHTGIGSTQQWEANLRQSGQAVGIGIRGSLRSGLELGGDLNHYQDVAEQRMSAALASVLTPGFSVTSLPDYKYQLTELKLFGAYPIDNSSRFRIEYQYSEWKTDDWTWQGWTYSDGTTLAEKPEQRTHFLGASYQYRWR